MTDKRKTLRNIIYKNIFIFFLLIIFANISDYLLLKNIDIDSLDTEKTGWSAFIADNREIFSIIMVFLLIVAIIRSIRYYKKSLNE